MGVSPGIRKWRLLACVRGLCLIGAGCATASEPIGEGPGSLGQGETGVAGASGADDTPEGSPAEVGSDSTGTADGDGAGGEISENLGDEHAAEGGDEHGDEGGDHEACLEEVVAWCLDECEHEGAEADHAERCAEELTAFCEREFAHECEPADGDGEEPPHDDEPGGEEGVDGPLQRLLGAAEETLFLGDLLGELDRLLEVLPRRRKISPEHLNTALDLVRRRQLGVEAASGLEFDRLFLDIM